MERKELIKLMELFKKGDSIIKVELDENAEEAIEGYFETKNGYGIKFKVTD